MDRHNSRSLLCGMLCRPSHAGQADQQHKANDQQHTNGRTPSDGLPVSEVTTDTRKVPITLA